MDTYDFESKHLYRSRRESAIDRLAEGRFRDRKVAYLDTKEALDTIAYLKRGYKPQNLWAINENPAEVALLTSRLKSLNLPTVNTVGLSFEDAITRRVPEDVSVIDFDGMSCLHDSLVDMIQRIVQKRPRAIHAITILAGRESSKSDRYGTFKPGALTDKVLESYPQWRSQGYKEVVDVCEKTLIPTTFGTKVRTSHWRRLRSLLSDAIGMSKDFTCTAHITRVIWDVYVSISKQPMLWCAVKSEPHKPISLGEAVSIALRAEEHAYPFCKYTESFMAIRCPGVGPK